MRVLVTGATGFIGMRLCKALVDRGHEVMGTSRNPSVDRDQMVGITHTTYLMGKTLPESVVSFSPEVLAHLSWSGIPDFSARTCAANVADQVHFLDETKKLTQLTKVLVAGSCAEYGAQKGLCQEADRNPPDSYFSWAKQSLYDYFRLSCQKRELLLLWLRVFYVYGPGQRSAALIPTLLKAFRSGQRPDIRNPTAANDFIFVDDVVDAFILGIEQRAATGVLNIGSGRQSTVLEVSQIAENLINKVTTYSEGFSEGHREVEAAVMVADISQAKSVLGWEPKVRLPEGIARTVEMTA